MSTENLGCMSCRHNAVCKIWMSFKYQCNCWGDTRESTTKLVSDVSVSVALNCKHYESKILRDRLERKESEE